MSEFYCDICCTSMQKSQKRIHLAGKKHLRGLSSIDTRERRLEITGSDSITDDAVRQHFEQFGEIKSVFMNADKVVLVFKETFSINLAMSFPQHVINEEVVSVREAVLPRKVVTTAATAAAGPTNPNLHCDVCDTTVLSDEQMASHLEGKKHLKAVALAMNHDPRKLVVMGAYHNLQHVQTYFTRYGTVDNIAKRPTTLELTFADPKSCALALAAREHTINSEVVKVVPPLTSVSQYHCEICNLDLPETHYRTHVDGKKHRRVMTKAVTEGRALLVNGYQMTDFFRVREYFSRYGQINSVAWLGRQLVVMFAEGSGCRQALQVQRHFIAGQAVTVTTEVEPGGKAATTEGSVPQAQNTPAQNKPFQHTHTDKHTPDTLSAQQRPPPSHGTHTERSHTASTHTASSQYHKNYCDVCETFIPDYLQHVSTPSHRQTDAQRRTLRVSQLPATHQRCVTEYFSQYGVVKNVRLFPQYHEAEVVFQSPDGQSAALAAPRHYLQGAPITVAAVTKPSRLKETWAELNSRTQGRERSDMTLLVRQSIKATPTSPDQACAAQISALLSQLAAYQRVVPAKRDFVTELQTQLRRFLPEVSLQVYGSTASGLSLLHSDIDIALDLDTTVNRQRVDILPSPPLDLREFPGFQQDRGLVTLASVVNASTQQVLDFFALCLRACSLSRDITHIRPIATARVPVLKLNHRRHGHCDITFGARLSVVNTRLLTLLTRIDQRFPQLLAVVRVWARQVGVASSDYRHSLSNYALTLLVYFYLENTSPPVLPTVQGLADIQRSDSPSDLVQGWDCSFCEDVAHIQRLLLPETNTQSLPELLSGFFTFYANLDIYNNVVCPRTGWLVDVMRFRQQMAAQPQIGAFVLSDVMVQDPLELSHNVCAHVSERAARGHVIEELVKAAVKILHQGATWTLRTFLPVGTFQASAAPPPRDRPLTFHLQLWALPPTFHPHASPPELEIHWHRWLLDMTLKVLGILRIDTDVNDGQQTTSSQPTGNGLPNNQADASSTTSGQYQKHSSIRDEATQSEVTQAQGGGSREVIDLSGDVDGGSDSDVIILGEESGQSSSESSYTESSYTESSDAERSDVEPSVFDPPKDRQSSSSSSPSTTKRKAKERRSRSKKARGSPAARPMPAAHPEPTVYAQSRPEPAVYTHPRVSFPLEKRVRQETVITCRAYCDVWDDKGAPRLPRDSHADSFRYHEAQVCALMEARGAHMADQPLLSFVLRMRRYTYGHNTAIEFLPGPLPNKLVYKLKSLLHECISTSLYHPGGSQTS